MEPLLDLRGYIHEKYRWLPYPFKLSFTKVAEDRPSPYFCG
jgi:hypothetical protein